MTVPTIDRAGKCAGQGGACQHKLLTYGTESCSQLEHTSTPSFLRVHSSTGSTSNSPHVDLDISRMYGLTNSTNHDPQLVYILRISGEASIAIGTQPNRLWKSSFISLTKVWDVRTMTTMLLARQLPRGNHDQLGSGDRYRACSSAPTQASCTRGRNPNQKLPIR